MKRCIDMDAQGVMEQYEGLVIFVSVFLLFG